LLLFASSSYAEYGDTAPDFSCDLGIESGSNFAFGGKPISLVSGAETFSRTDLSLGSLYPINVQRRYNSRSGYDSPLGYGWALNYDKRIYTYPDSSVTLRKECGWKIRFTWSADDKKGATLVVTALAKDDACHLAYVEASGNPKANDQARAIADRDARSFQCKGSSPKHYGADGKEVQL